MLHWLTRGCPPGCVPRPPRHVGPEGPSRCREGRRGTHDAIAFDAGQTGRRGTRAQRDEAVKGQGHQGGRPSGANMGDCAGLRAMRFHHFWQSHSRRRPALRSRAKTAMRLRHPVRPGLILPACPCLAHSRLSARPAGPGLRPAGIGEKGSGVPDRCGAADPDPMRPHHGHCHGIARGPRAPRILARRRVSGNVRKRPADRSVAPYPWEGAHGLPLRRHQHPRSA